ncbi:phosphatidate cytidylyltransferase [Rhizohabitans arisaemae]|uniref:phosphatidate cytidylyltransferase n=1 Tax=Rhizohabitans arisaemae TaxID=2720610 RepID=UPI0024B041B7|nr:phosphatidate cytidylyltransferase [Rhizohabitans arisaemae]
MTRVEDFIPYIAVALVAGGIGVALSGNRGYLLRWCAWAVAVPAVVAALLLGPGGAAVLAAAAAAICATEYALLTRLPRPDQALLTVVASALPLAAWLAPGRLLQVFVAGLLAVALVPVVAGDADDGLRRLSLNVLGVVWFAPLVAVVLLNPALVLAVFTAVSVTDIAASFGGRFLRGPRLSPLSPGKHWSGVLVGAAAGLAVLALLGAFTPLTAVAVSLGAPVGDLLESMVKRGVATKDSATWLADAGGLLDRLDSLLPTLALSLLFCT